MFICSEKARFMKMKIKSTCAIKFSKLIVQQNLLCEHTSFTPHSLKCYDNALARYNSMERNETLNQK